MLLLAVGLLYGYGRLVVAPPSSQEAAASPPPPGPSGATGRPTGLVQAGNSKSTCVYVRELNFDLSSSLAQVDRATGIHYSCLETFENGEVTWAQWVDPWVTKPAYDYASWLRARPRTRTVVLTISLVPDAVAETPSWRATCASGAYRGYARALARRLVATGFRYSVIRLGPEMNGTWYLDSIGSSPTQWHQWATCYAQIVSAMRSVPGEDFLFDWNVNAGYLPIPLADYYPGNAYVNIVGVDAYDTAPSASLPPPSPSRWRALSSEPLGLLSVARFAAVHGKPLSIPEWGTQANVGDDGLYVAEMARLILTHDVAYQSWFDSGSDGVLPLTSSAAPRSLAAYVAAFGPSSAIAAYQQRVDG